MIEIKEMTSESGLRKFVEFPFKLLNNNPYWAPPIIREELETFDRKKNPVFSNADAHFFMAYRDGRPVGRIAAIINWLEVNEQNKPKIRFGWYDAIDDLEVTEALIAEVEKVGRQHGLKFMEGPVGFSNMDKAGMLVEGFEELNTMITWYSLPYYHQHFEELGFAAEKEWVEFKIKIPEEGPSEKVERFSNLILNRYDLQVIRFNNKHEILEHVDKIFELINQTYSGLSTYVPIGPEQIAYYKQKYFRYLHPDFINCVANSEGEIVAFAITMPSFTKALQRANGRLFPLGWLHLLWARFFHQRAAFYLIGIKPEYQNKGLTSIIFKEMNEMFNRRGIKEVETNPELEDNKAIQALWNSYENEQHKRRRTYRRDLTC
ncbi:GNAT family N-acetyltransferase [Aliifodinibius sp. S!AR15-10]|uniref:GNAT family N-acetyltransferase n=1 Tax=Aliifodinibius sp. S!AR15-10 TaxID=2950437 RepID=UPI0028662EF8|nr:GNAT family N-acetyltransferase [Aliifodinibius sp. S!AR15-10]MDR8389632.1 GNAT family N-acetyltransferase [Aliifodinibius sp. S!AR15-10]